MDKQEVRDKLAYVLDRRESSEKNAPHSYYEAELEYCDDMLTEACIQYLLLDQTEIPLPTQGRAERVHLYLWMRGEEEYVAGKFDSQRDDHDASMQDDGLDSEGFWLRQVVQYYDRARVFLQEARECRLDGKPDVARLLELRGQQAIVKAFMTAKGCAESSIRSFGPLPKPGLPSGYVEEWTP